MNDVRTATAKLRRQFAASLALETDPAIRLIHALREVHGTGDDAQEDLAVAAVADGRAAFWTTVTDHYNQVAGLFLQLANMSGLDVAIEYRRGDELAGYQRTALFNLDCLIPLNEAALKQLRQAKHEEWARAPRCDRLSDAARALWKAVDNYYDLDRNDRPNLPIDIYDAAQRLRDLSGEVA